MCPLCNNLHTRTRWVIFAAACSLRVTFPAKKKMGETRPGSDRKEGGATPGERGERSSWKRLVMATWISAKDFFRDDGPYWSGSIAFYSLLSSLPLALLLALAASLVVDSDGAVELVSGVAGDLLPQGEERIREVMEEAYNGRGVAGFFSIIVLLWSGTHVFGAISRALNVAFNVPARRPMWIQVAMQFAMVSVVGTLLILGLLSRVLIDVIWTLRDIGEDERVVAYTVLRNALPLLFTAVAFFLVYRFVPQRKPGWKSAAAGAVLASVAFFIAREVFFLYQTMTGGFDRVYGPIALLVALLFWIWIAGVILLVGGQLVAHYQEILVHGEDPEAVEARHVEAKMLRTSPEG